MMKELCGCRKKKIMKASMVHCGPFLTPWLIFLHSIISVPVKPSGYSQRIIRSLKGKLIFIVTQSKHNECVLEATARRDATWSHVATDIHM